MYFRAPFWAAPELSFHGTDDPNVPYDKEYSLGNPALKTFGSACVHRALARAGVKSILKPFVGMGHGAPGGDPRADTPGGDDTGFRI